MTIDVIIPTLNRQEQIQECIDSIKKQTVPATQIIIVDSSDEQTLEKILTSNYPELSIQYQHTSKGLTYQRNVGVSASSSDFILFLDDDIVLLDTFIEKIIPSFDAKTGAVTGKIINDGRKIKINPFLILFQKLFFLSESKDGKFKLSGDYNVKHPYLNDIHEVDVAIGGLTMYRKEVFEHYSFDLNYQYLEGYSSLEDEDFSLQLKHKFNIKYNTFARAYHYHQTAQSTRLNIYKRGRLRAFNYRYFYRKHKTHYKLKAVPHFLSCMGMIIEAALNKKSFATMKGLIAGFVLFIYKKNELKHHV